MERRRNAEREREREEEWARLCHELEKAKQNYAAAEAAIADSCQTAPRKGGEIADAKNILQENIEANLRKIDILRKMRVFISELD